MKLLRLEQRRVLNADFTFVAHGLSLDHVDGDLTVREVSGSSGHQIEFDLAGGSLWQDHGSTGVLAIDNSAPGHSILSIAKSDLESLSSGVSLHAASSDFDLQFDVQSSALDLSQMHGTLAAEGFGQIHETAANDHQVRLGDVSLSGDHITLSQFHGDDITLNASEIDLTGGANSFSGSTLSIHAAATPNIELGGTSDTAHELNFTDSDITALDAGFHRISFESTSADADSSIHVDSAGSDFHHAIAAGHDGSLQLTADSVQIDGALSISGGLIDVTATHAATISATGSLISHGGQVHVDAGESGTLLDSGRVDVSNSEPDGIGGTVHLLGEQVGLFGSAEVDASGHSGGGEVLIGGDLHGDNDAIHHAAQTFIGHDVEIHADALHHGDGGQIVVWSDEVTQVYGALTARGGALLGDGGLIETSSHNQLIVTRGGDASAANGNAGTWLLDPLNVKIVLAPSAVYLVTEFAPLPFFTPTVVGSEVTADAIVDQLKTGTTVVISTFNPNEAETGDVIQEALINVPFVNAGDSATFIISAANDIFINGGFNATNGSLNILLEANADSDDLDQAAGNVNINASINTNGGSFSSTGVDFDSAGITLGNTSASITATGGVSITHTGTVDLGVISTGTGFGGTTFISDANVRGAINVGEGNVLIDGGNDGMPDSANDDLHVLANITATDTIFLLADRDVIVEATVTADSSNPSADLSITSDANSNGVGGFMLDEDGSVTADAQLKAGGNITVVGADLVVTTTNTDDSLVIENDGAKLQVMAGQDLTLVANFGSASTAGDILIDGVMQATDGALTVFFTGTAFLSANQSAGTDLLFQNAVRLTNLPSTMPGTVTLTAGNDATIASTIDDSGVGNSGTALSVVAGGDVLFVGKVGSMTDGALNALSVNGNGLIDFLNSVTVDGNIAVMANSETGRVTFQDAVTTNAGSVTITNAGLLVTSSSAQFNVNNAFVQDGDGSTELGADITTTNGEVKFKTAVVLTSAVTVNSNNHDITFGGTIDSEVAGANEEQTISLTNLTSTSFKISWNPQDPPGIVSGIVGSLDGMATSFTATSVTGFPAVDADPGSTDFLIQIDSELLAVTNVVGNVLTVVRGQAGTMAAAHLLGAPLNLIETTASIPAGATAAMVKTALVALPSLTADDIDVAGDPGGPFTLTFRGAFRGTDVNEVTVAGTGLTPSAVLTTVQGKPIIAEHNPLTLIAGTGTILFQGNIGTGFVDVGLGVDGDQTPGDLTINSASRVTFNPVSMVVTTGTIDIGAVSPISDGNALTVNDISINGSPTTFRSGENIRINGQTMSLVDLSLLAAGDVELTEFGNLSTDDTTPANNDHSITIVADLDSSSVGDFRMAAPTTINSGNGFIDVRAAEVFLGKLTSTSANTTDDENPAIRVMATFRSINDNNGDLTNLVAERRTIMQDTGAGTVLSAVLGIGSTDNPLETEIASLSAFNHDRSEQQVVTLEKAQGGTFTISWDPPGAVPEKTTAPLPFNASAADVKTAFFAAINSLPLPLPVPLPGSLPFSMLDFDVAGERGGPYVFTFLGQFQATNVAEVTTSGTNLIGVGASIKPETIADPQRAENNIVIRDVGTNNGNRVDLIFVHNQANQIESQFANVVGEFQSAIGGKMTEITFSAATPGPTNNDIVIDFTISHHLGEEDTNKNGKIDLGEDLNGNNKLDGATIGVPVITVDGHLIHIDLDYGEDTDGDGVLDSGEDKNNNGNLDGTTANAVIDAINSDHAANQLIRARLTGTDPTSDPRAPGTDDVTRSFNSIPIPILTIPFVPSATPIRLSPAGNEDGVININVTQGSLRVVADNSRLVLSEMQRGIDTFNPPDLAVAAVQSENTIKLTASTIEVFDDILAISAKTQTAQAIPQLTEITTITAQLNATALSFIVVDPSVLPAVDGDPGSTDFLIQIDSEVLAVTNIVGNTLTVQRGQDGTQAVAHAIGASAFVPSTMTLQVVDLSVFPRVDSGPNKLSTTDFFIRIDSEVLAVKDIDIDGNLLTVERGQNGTAAGAMSGHAAGTLISDIAIFHPSAHVKTSGFDRLTTTLTVDDPSIFPGVDSGPNRFTTTDFFIQIDSEILAVKNVAGNVLTVMRGQAGTLATAHSGTSGTMVGAVVTTVNPPTRVTAALTDSDLTLTAEEFSVLPIVDLDANSTDFFIQIDSEILAVTDVVRSTTDETATLTVLRGQSGTMAVAHTAQAALKEFDPALGYRQYIEIQARTNFVLGADRVISTDDHYLNSLNVAEDLNGNGKLDTGETFIDANGNGQFDPAEPFTDTNGNRVFDVGEPFADVTLNANGLPNGMFDPSEQFTDANGNGKFDTPEDFNGDKMLQFNTGEDINRNGALDLNEDTNGDGTLQFRGDKPATTRTDDFFSQIDHDVIHITADSTVTAALNDGRVLLGENATISTDNGIEQLISSRPVFTGITNGVFNYQPGSAFFSGNVVASNFTSRFLFDGDEVLPDGTTLQRNSVVFLGTVTFTIGSPGEKNLILDIDWGDHDRTLVSEVPPTTANTVAPSFDIARNAYVFDPTRDQHATRYLIPEGGASYSIPHEYSQNGFNLKSADGQVIQEPGRGNGVTSDPIQIRFAVSQHSSIVIDGQAVLDPRIPPENVATAPSDVPLNAPVDNKSTGLGVNFPKENSNPADRPIPVPNADRLFQLSSTDVLDNPDLFLPRFDNGLVAFSIPTPPSVPIPPTVVVIPPPALPSPFTPNAVIPSAPQITTETSRSSAASASVTTEEYFELRRTNEGDSITAERLDDRVGESLLNRERFEEYVRELGDGEYEILFITRDTKYGTTIPRSVIQFRLESGRLVPPTNDSPNLFKPFKLIPVLKVPKPVQPVPPNKPNGNGAAANQNPDAPDDGNQKPSDDEMSALPLHERHSDIFRDAEYREGEAPAEPCLPAVLGSAGASPSHLSDSSFALSGTALAAGDSIVESDPSNASETAPIAVGLLLVAGTRWRKNRFNPFGTALFSKTARLARKRIALPDDQ